MKKTLLLSLILLSGILLTACGKKDEEPTQNIEPVEIIENNDCEGTIQDYLDGANKQWNWEEIKEWDNIVVDYIWRLEDWTVFDTSIESIAKACEKFSEGRDYTQWLSFEVWAGQMIKWFDNWVIWMKLWQTKTVKFWPEEWYGKYDESLVVKAPIDEVGDVSQLNVWDTVYLWMGYPAKILEITNKEVIFDMNHELAGKDLIFDITVKSIN